MEGLGGRRGGRRGRSLLVGSKRCLVVVRGEVYLGDSRIQSGSM